MAERLGRLGSTPSQTVGPFLHIALAWPDGPEVCPERTPGAVRIAGRITDGAGDPVTDALVEVWGADRAGRFAHPDDPRGPAGRFRGFGRCPTDVTGGYWFRTLKPGPLPADLGSAAAAVAAVAAGESGATGPVGAVEAPHLDVSIFARGLLDRLVTRIYFPDEVEANAADPVLSGLDPADRARLTATTLADGSLRFDIRLQGADETPFFQV